MSRAFSASVRRIKELKWKLNGTTDNVEWAKNTINKVVDQVPGLAGKVDSGIINGNPHPTGKDPFHASGVIGKGSMKGNDRATSFHVYPDGRVKFSDKALGEITVAQDSSTPAEGSEDDAKKSTQDKHAVQLPSVSE